MLKIVHEMPPPDILLLGRDACRFIVAREDTSSVMHLLLTNPAKSWIPKELAQVVEAHIAFPVPPTCDDPCFMMEGDIVLMVTPAEVGGYLSYATLRMERV
jgi:hypothetical protein